MTNKIRKFHSILTSQAVELSHNVSCLLSGQLDFGLSHNLNQKFAKTDDQFFVKIKLPLSTLKIIDTFFLVKNLIVRNLPLSFQNNAKNLKKSIACKGRKYYV